MAARHKSVERKYYEDRDRLLKALRNCDRRTLLKISAATMGAIMARGLIPPVHLQVVEVGERADGGARAVLRGDKEGHDSLVRLPAESRPAAGSARTELLRQMSRERVAIRAARGQVWSAVAGPALTSILFLVIAGPMLPGSGGFAAAHYALNTTLILFLSYGIAPLVAWSALALILIGSPAGTTSTEA